MSSKTILPLNIFQSKTKNKDKLKIMNCKHNTFFLKNICEYLTLSAKLQQQTMRQFQSHISRFIIVPFFPLCSEVCWVARLVFLVLLVLYSPAALCSLDSGTALDLCTYLSESSRTRRSSVRLLDPVNTQTKDYNGKEETRRWFCTANTS